MTTEEHVAIFDAVAAVLDKHLTARRWRVSTNPDDPDDDESNGWTRDARQLLAGAIEESILLRWNGNPAGAEPDFDDLRDYFLWQAMVDLVRSKDGVECKWRGCDCDCRATA